MIDFDKIISSILEQDYSIDELATQFTEALNKVTKDKNTKPIPAAAARKPVPKPTSVPTTKMSERDEYIRNITGFLRAHIKGEHFTPRDAGAIIWLSIVHDTDIGKSLTSFAELQDLMKFINHKVETMADEWQTNRKIKPKPVDPSLLNNNKDKGDNKECITKSKIEQTKTQFQRDMEEIDKFFNSIFSN